MELKRKPRSRPWRTVAAMVACVSVLPLAACGSSDNSSTTADKTASAATTGATTTAAASTGADQAAAQKLLAPYQGKPSAFPVDTPLAKKPAPDSIFAFLQCAASTCGLASQALDGATKTLGVQYKPVKAGASASDVQNAMDSIVALDPTAVISGGIELSGVGPQLKQLTSKDVAVSTFGALDAANYGVQASINGDAALELDGALMAAWAVAQEGDDTNVVLYTTSELQPSKAEQKGFEETMAKLCPDCKVRTANIPIAEYGTTAPATITSDLQRHPDTNVAAFVTGDQAVGLPAALKTAGIDIKTITTGPVPANLQDIKSGGLTAGLAVDIPVMLWMTVDAAARIATGQPLTAGEKAGQPPIQLLEQKDITFDPSQGWTGYPDFPQRFAKLWGAPAS